MVLVQFDVARASCACIHGRDARATFSNCTSTGAEAGLRNKERRSTACSETAHPEWRRGGNGCTEVQL